EQLRPTQPAQEGVQDQEVTHSVSPRGSNTGGSILDGNGGSGLRGTQQAVDQTTSEAQWTPMVRQLEELTSDKVALYVAIERQLYPSGWSGSLAIILEKRRPLLDSLAAHIDSEVRAWASAAKVRLDNRIATERKHEQTESASFE
ncbi:MAG TPA: hypothetical protein VJ743_17290, partial [Albitalea sp.]|nr:hypothetical protein [Albitalea sp.]